VALPLVVSPAARCPQFPKRGEARGRDGDGRRALEAGGARRARRLRAGLLPRRDPEIASPLARYVRRRQLPSPFPLSSQSAIAARLTAASLVVQITLGGSTDYARDHLRGI